MWPDRPLVCSCHLFVHVFIFQGQFVAHLLENALITASEHICIPKANPWIKLCNHFYIFFLLVLLWGELCVTFRAYQSTIGNLVHSSFWHSHCTISQKGILSPDQFFTHFNTANVTLIWRGLSTIACVLFSFCSAGSSSMLFIFHFQQLKSSILMCSPLAQSD